MITSRMFSRWRRDRALGWYRMHGQTASAAPTSISSNAAVMLVGGGFRVLRITRDSGAALPGALGENRSGRRGACLLALERCPTCPVSRTRSCADCRLSASRRGPAYTSLADPEFPEKLAEYAGAVAKRYPWIGHYTPVNEPLTTARFSGWYGLWYPTAVTGL